MPTVALIPVASIPVAASTALAHVLDGAPQAFRVVTTGRYAAYLTAPTGAVVAVVVPGATAPPCALLVPDGVRPDALFAADDVVRVGDGRVVTSAGDLRVARWWDPASVRRSGSPSLEGRRLLRQLIDSLPDGLDPEIARARASAPAAATAAVHGDRDAAVTALTEVLGLGPGLTPSGDDVAAGVLLVLRATAGAAGGTDVRLVDDVARAVTTAAPARTTTVSAALLAEAAAGRAAAPFVAAVSSLVDGTPGAGQRPVFERLLEVGHTSGADTAAGMLAAADAVALARQRATTRALDHRRTA